MVIAKSGSKWAPPRYDHSGSWCLLGKRKTRKDNAMATKATTQSNTITNGQIGQICDRLTTKLRESGFPTEPVQSVLSEPGCAFIDEMFAAFRKRVEAVSNLIVRKVTVNVNRTPQEALDATQRKQYTDRKVVDCMPKGLGGEVEIVFFKLDLSERDGYISDDDLEKEYELRGLKPAAPFSVAALNEADPAFADEKPHGTHWKDENGKWCYAAFFRWSGERGVYVYRSDRDWYDNWSFAGVRK